MISQTNAFTSHQLVLVDDNGPAEHKIMGWIRLLNGEDDAGYVYLSAKPVKSRLGGEEPYVVMSRPPSELGAILAVLQDGRAKRITYFGDDSAGGLAFIEHDVGLGDNDGEDHFRRMALGLPPL